MEKFVLRGDAARAYQAEQQCAGDDSKRPLMRQTRIIEGSKVVVEEHVMRLRDELDAAVTTANMEAILDELEAQYVSLEMMEKTLIGLSLTRLERRTESGCRLITTYGQDLSDGSERPSVQPLLDPQAWFLSESELTSSRGGVPRQDLSVFTSGNDVSPLPTTDTYFASLYRDLEATGANDTVYMTAWSVDQVPFLPMGDERGEKTGFHGILRRAVARGTDVRAIVWPNVLERKQNVQFRDFMNDVLPKPKPYSARFLFDDRLPTPTSSHHQKTFVLRRHHALVAYVGGIDPTSDRWDTVAHDQQDLRRRANIRRHVNGWLDAHVRIAGPAAKDVAANFLARWNSKVKPSQDLLDDLLDFENPTYTTLPAVDSMGPLMLTTAKNHHVQITRTFSCKYPHYDEYAPRGETSILASRLKAIRQARNYIYIEDQYFVLVPELRDALLEVLPRLQRLIVVAQRTLTETKVTGYEKYVLDMVEPLQRQFPNKFQLFTTKRSRGLYIHSKLVIIDDAYVSVGSANWNRRSMTSDSEINANVVDGETVETPDGMRVSKVVREFRVRKFVEMTGKSYAELDSMRLLDAANALDAAASDPSSILEVLEVQEKPDFVAFTDVVRRQVDPDDKC
ncbi:hypothetical protein ATCC90586_007617 [Pythium insidiosum]|nr:hypothetical protein ATCC90586_007617 [Pythium insidiosum]